MSMTTESKSNEKVQTNALADFLQHGDVVEVDIAVRMMKSPATAPKSRCVWKGEGVIHAERVMNYQLQRIRNERCIVEGCHARKFKSGMCKRHSKVV